MSRRELLSLLLIDALALAGGTALFVALFHTPLLASVGVLFYRGIGLLVVATVVTVALLVVVRRLRYRALIGARDILLVASLLFSANLVFFTHVPVTADRSITVFMLGYLDESGQALTGDQIADVLVDRYFLAGDAAGKRLDEQLASGNLVKSADGYRISDQGRSLMAIYKLIAPLFGLDTRNLAP